MGSVVVGQFDSAGAAQGPVLRYDVEPFSGCLVVTLSGEIDIHNCAELDRVLRGAAVRTPRVVVDLTAITFIDSSGIGALLRARTRATAAGEALFLVHPPQPVRRILRGTHLESPFTIFDNLNEAVGHVSRSKTAH